MATDYRDTTEWARIREYERELAPGSETVLLGEAIESLREDPSHANLAWWLGAYRMLAWATACPVAWARDVGRGMWDDPVDMILHAGEDWAEWAPPAPTPSALRAWRERERLTLARAAALAGVTLRAWQRWEAGERSVPQWLRDTLMQRWGNAP